MPKAYREMSQALGREFGHNTAVVGVVLQDAASAAIEEFSRQFEQKYPLERIGDPPRLLPEAIRQSLP